MPRSILKPFTIYLLLAREIREKAMKYQLIRLLYPYRCSKYALLYIRKFLLKEKQLHSIEMDWRYKQARTPLLVCTP